MELAKNSGVDLAKIFDEYTTGGDLSFSKTVIPVSLAQYGDDKLISRSQAKRVLVRVEKFKRLVFDFQGVDTIGQAFADEIFRAFSRKNPETQITYFNANEQVDGMISRVMQNQD